MDAQLRLAIYDVVAMDGKEYTDESMEEKLKVISGIFKDGKTVQPVYGIQGGIKEAEQLCRISERCVLRR